MTKLAIQDGLVIGVDIGGTKVAAGLVDGSGEILAQTRTPMVPTGEAAAGLKAVISAIESVSAKYPEIVKQHGLLRGVGICSPGPLRSEERRVGKGWW